VCVVSLGSVLQVISLYTALQSRTCLAWQRVLLRDFRFHGDVNEIFFLLGCKQLRLIVTDVSGPLNMGPIVSPETSVTDCYSTLRKSLNSKDFKNIIVEVPSVCDGRCFGQGIIERQGHS